jgi:hypothetical protein
MNNEIDRIRYLLAQDLKSRSPLISFKDSKCAINFEFILKDDQFFFVGRKPVCVDCHRKIIEEVERL